MAVFPLENDSFFILFLFVLFLVVILGKHPKLGVDLSVNILGLYHLKLEEGTTTTKRCVEVDLFFQRHHGFSVCFGHFLWPLQPTYSLFFYLLRKYY